MKPSLHDRIFHRELGYGPRSASINGIYGAAEWMDGLDIVNELGGHTGCVNALSWSRSGRLLASGSDDTYVNIYSYLTESSTVPFALSTSIATGHRANIFSVKFMPHSGDRTLVTCAGDSEVRIFDIEYSSQKNSASASESAAASTRSKRMTDFFTGVRYLDHQNTNTRVYRCHTDRVKRIVTESSPHLFLTCSEDGEVRQWDLRQPSSTYPAPDSSHGLAAYQSSPHQYASNVPPPLISYKRYHLDLNTISCAASQPHYIALGGAHLHCLLHDRRMLGRDLLAERGQVGGLSPAESHHDDESMNRATRCVRRFAPGGQKRMKPRDNGHITACKISDARPNELIVSWSGDHIYSFDLVRSPDAREQGAKTGSIGQSKKRKRGKVSSTTSLNSGNRHRSRMRSEEVGGSDPEMSLHIRYRNRDSEDIPITSLADESLPDATAEAIDDSVLTEAQKLSYRIAKSLMKLRKHLFSLETSERETTQSQWHYDLTSYEPSFTAALDYAFACLIPMDDIHRSWRYPINPSPDEVSLQRSLRRHREAARRFVQASATLAHFLGSCVEDYAEREDVREDLFDTIVPAPSEDGIIDRESQFGYDFLKAILLWLNGGRDSLRDGFKLQRNSPRNRRRFPIPDNASDDGAIEDYLIPYLRDLAGSTPIVDVDASRFEHDESRIIFHTQHDAVTAFEKAVQFSLEEPGTTAVQEGEDELSEHVVRALNRQAAIKYWALRVGRGLLMSVGKYIDFDFVNRAFGGSTAVTDRGDDNDDDDDDERIQQDIDPDDDSDEIEDFQLVSNRRRHTRRTRDVDENGDLALLDEDSGDDDEASALFGNDDDDNDDSGDDDSDDPDAFFLRRGSFPSSRYRAEVETNVPCVTHENVYKGHCNVKTVKDVNYYGLDDEYVVSGSDSGHIFIWDRRTAKLVNILEGDGEVVNVVQGHPYEPTLAASGIDNTVKIFSPDRRLQFDARHGVNILNPDHPANMFGSRPQNSAGSSQVFGLRSCKRMKDSYQIMSQNDVERQGGMSEAYITRSMLSRLAATLRQRHAMPHANPGMDSDGATIVLDDNCTVM